MDGGARSKSKFCVITLENYSNDENKDIIIDVWFCMKKLLQSKILGHLNCTVDLSNNTEKLKFSSSLESDQSRYFKIFSAAEERTPELVWND